MAVAHGCTVGTAVSRPQRSETFDFGSSPLLGLARRQPQPSDRRSFGRFTFWLSRLSIMASFAPETNLKALDGMRAVCSLWVVLVHCWMLWAVQLPYSALRDIGNASWLPW